MPPFHTVPSRSRTTPTAVLVAALVTVALAAGGCSSDSSTPAAAPSSSPSQQEQVARPVASKVRLGKVAGTIKRKSWKEFMKHHDKPMLKQVGQAVDSWIDGGFVGVDYPRDAFPQAFAAFTKQAKHDARHQQRLMTNWDLRKKIDGVDVKKRTVTVDAMAPRGRPAGATARVSLVFTTSGDAKQHVTVRGRLFLSPGHGRWHIFGYDVSRGAK